MSEVAAERIIAPHEATTIPLSSEDATALRAVVRTRLDATRAAELMALRAKLAVGEALDAETRLLSLLGERYGFDPDLPCEFGADGVLRLTEPVA